MALFKISKGLKANLPTEKTVGYCWYTTDDSLFYIDYEDENGTIQRKPLNAKDAETLTGASLNTILNSSDIEIPTSKAVLDALSTKANMSDLPIIKDSSAGTINLTWDGEIGDKDSFQFGTWTYCKQSSIVPEYSSITGGSTFRSNGMQNTNATEGVNCYAFGDAIVVTSAGTCSKGGTQFEAPSTGIYFGRMSSWYTEELEMDCNISYTSLFTTDVNGTQHVIAIDENNLLSVTDTSNDSTVYMATTSYVDGKLNETANPDWNELDPDSKAYILNKPFYEIPTEKVIISNKQRTMSETSGTSINSYYINYNNSVINASTYSFMSEGQQCKLSYTLNNGSIVEITGNAKHYSVTSGYQYEYYVFGNQYLLNGLTSPSVATNLGSNINSGENTAVIFAIAYYDGEILTPNCCIYVVTTDIGMQTASLVLSVVDSDVVQLNERFIPDTIARISDLPDVSGQINDHNTSTEAHADIRAAIPSIEGLATEDYVKGQIKAIPTPDVSGQIATHNTNQFAHSDIREAISAHVNNTNNPHGMTAEQIGLGGAIVLNETEGDDARLNGSNSWKLIAYGDGKFVAISRDNKVACSTDGAHWTEGSIPVATGTYWQSIAYGNGKFVAVAWDGYQAAYSSDGLTWVGTSLPSSLNDFFNGVDYVNGKFIVTIGNSTKAAYSTDGIQWVDGITLPYGSWYSVTYGAGKYVATSSGNEAAYSTDGVTWTMATLPSSNGYYASIYGGDKFVAAGPRGGIAYSTDGTTWSAVSLQSSENWHSLAYGNNTFVAASNKSSKIAVSNNGVDWTLHSLPISSSQSVVTYGDGKFVAISYDSNVVHISYDGITWVDTIEGKTILADSTGTDITESVKELVAPDISSKQDKLTGTEGQIVGFDENGNAVAQDMPIPDAYTKAETYTKSEVDAAIAAAIEAAFAGIARAEEVSF